MKPNIEWPQQHPNCLKRPTQIRFWKFIHHCRKAIGLGSFLLTLTGCQTFTLSEEDFQKQQRGEMVDPQVGAAVAVGGTAAYMGAIIGAAAAGLR